MRLIILYITGIDFAQMKIKNLLRNMRNNPLLWKYNGLLIWMVAIAIFSSLSCCSDQALKAPADVVIAKSPEEIEEKIEEQLKQSIDFISNNGGKMNDSTAIQHMEAGDSRKETTRIPLLC